MKCEETDSAAQCKETFAVREWRYVLSEYVLWSFAVCGGGDFCLFFLLSKRWTFLEWRVSWLWTFVTLMWVTYLSLSQQFIFDQSWLKWHQRKFFKSQVIFVSKLILKQNKKRHWLYLAFQPLQIEQISEAQNETYTRTGKSNFLVMTMVSSRIPNSPSW